jgi:hypothetical protein
LEQLLVDSGVSAEAGKAWLHVLCSPKIVGIVLFADSRRLEQLLPVESDVSAEAGVRGFAVATCPYRCPHTWFCSCFVFGLLLSVSVLLLALLDAGVSKLLGIALQLVSCACAPACQPQAAAGGG